MSAPLPDACWVALKEWALVGQALLRGEQCVLIRKGGLIEPGSSGFTVRSDTFLFYPTFEHQTVNYVREPFQGYFEQAIAWKPVDQQLRFEFGGQVVASTQTHEASIIKRLEPFHIYNDAFLTQRLKWQPDQPLVIVLVRAFRLTAPQVIPLSTNYAGCKSWVDLEQPVSLAGARPVVDDHVFDERARQVRTILGQAG